MQENPTFDDEAAEDEFQAPVQDEFQVKGDLQITLKVASGLPNADLIISKNDGFVICTIGGQTLQTQIVDNVTSTDGALVWNETLTFSQPAKDAVMTIQVRKTPSWPRSWASFSLLSLYSHRNSRANLHCLGQPHTFLAIR